MQRRRYSRETIVSVLDLVAAGVAHADVAARCDVPVNTLRKWLYRGVPKIVAVENACGGCGAEEHDFTALPADDYAYVLGVYLGDGCIGRHVRTTSLRVTLDTAYPGIIETVVQQIGVIRGREPCVGRGPRGEQCVVIVSYWKQWPCLLPQHGPGRKHHRPIVLADWQQALVDEAPQAFLRGLIHTDGWRGLNKVTVKGRDYQYPRYQFSNRSDDIRTLFTDTCDKLGIAWRPWGRWHISVARKDAVAAMDAFIGPKT
jgi:hypothetical protein